MDDSDYRCVGMVGASTSPSLTRRGLVAGCLAALLPSCGKRSVERGLRVVSLAPSMTEALHAIEAGALLVGRTAHCDKPREVASLPSVGGYAEPDFERVLALSPTLVIGERGPAGPSFEARLRERGIPTYFPPTNSVAEIGAMLVGLGARVGRDAEAGQARRRLDEEVERMTAWARARPSVSVVMVFDEKPLFVAGKGGFPDELLRLAGGRNLVEGGGPFPTIDLERMLALDPEVVIDATDAEAGTSELVKLEGWGSLAAVRSGKVRKLASDAAMRPGPRLAEGLAAVARALHGVSPLVPSTTGARG